MVLFTFHMAVPTGSSISTAVAGVIQPTNVLLSEVVMKPMNQPMVLPTQFMQPIVQHMMQPAVYSNLQLMASGTGSPTGLKLP